jgi:hypothetical protein
MKQVHPAESVLKQADALLQHCAAIIYCAAMFVGLLHTFWRPLLGERLQSAATLASASWSPLIRSVVQLSAPSWFCLTCVWWYY